MAAAEAKLNEIVAAAEADGHVDEAEQRQIDAARKELLSLQVASLWMRGCGLEGERVRVRGRG